MRTKSILRSMQQSSQRPRHKNLNTPSKKYQYEKSKPMKLASLLNHTKRPVHISPSHQTFLCDKHVANITTTSTTTPTTLSKSPFAVLATEKKKTGLMPVSLNKNQQQEQSDLNKVSSAKGGISHADGAVVNSTPSVSDPRQPSCGFVQSSNVQPCIGDVHLNSTNHVDQTESTTPTSQTKENHTEINTPHIKEETKSENQPQATNHVKQENVNNTKKMISHPHQQNARTVASGVKKYMRRRAYNLLLKDPYFKLLFTRLAQEKAAMMNTNINNNNTNNSTNNNIPAAASSSHDNTTVVDTTSPPIKQVVEASTTPTYSKKHKHKHRKQNQHNYKPNSHALLEQQQQPTSLYHIIDGLFAKYEKQFDNTFQNFLTRYHHPLLDRRDIRHGDNIIDGSNPAHNTDNNSITQPQCDIEFTTIHNLLDDFFTKCWTNPFLHPSNDISYTSSNHMLQHQERANTTEVTNDNKYHVTTKSKTTASTTTKTTTTDTKPVVKHQVFRSAVVYDADGKLHYKVVKGSNSPSSSSPSQSSSDVHVTNNTPMQYELHYGVMDPTNNEHHVQKYEHLDDKQLNHKLQSLPALPTITSQTHNNTTPALSHDANNTNINSNNPKSIVAHTQSKNTNNTVVEQHPKMHKKRYNKKQHKKHLDKQHHVVHHDYPHNSTIEDQLQRFTHQQRQFVSKMVDYFNQHPFNFATGRNGVVESLFFNHPMFKAFFGPQATRFVRRGRNNSFFF